MRLGPTVDGSAEGPDASLRSCVRSLLDFSLFLKDFGSQLVGAEILSVVCHTAVLSYLRIVLC